MNSSALAALACMAVAVPAALAEDPSFEVASVKLASPSAGRGNRWEGGPGTASPGQWTCTNVPLTTLVMQAWDLTGFTFSHPASMNDARYDIAAKIPHGATVADFHLMIRRLLAERLALAVHQEPRELDVRELVVAKGGLKMKPAETAPEPAGPAPDGPRPTFDKDQMPHLPPGYPMSFHAYTSRGFAFIGRMQSMDELAKALPADHMVIDKTGLTGKYDYALRFAFAEPAAPDSSQDAPSSLESALIEQLGLQLRPAKATVDVLVVDRFNKTPTEN